MSYPRNAASPEPIAIGAVVQIADGAVQTSGCTVRIKPNGVAEGDGAGTTAYSTDGIVYYTPTQGETNYTSFILIAKKANCIPVSVTVVTSASSTAGHAALDWGVVINKTTANDLTGTTISPLQIVASVSGAVGSVTGAVGSVTGAVASVTGNVGGNVAGSVGSVTGNVGGNVTGSVGSVTAAVTVGTISTGAITAAAVAADAVAEIQSGLATSAVQTQILDTVSYNAAALYGACADPQTSAETYAITINGSTYTLDYTSQTSAGVRGTTTRTKT